MMSTLALVDWNWTGHVPLYAASIARVFNDQGWKVHHLCPEPAQASENLCSTLGINVQCHLLDVQNGSKSESTQNWSPKQWVQMRWEAVGRGLREVNQADRVNFVFLPWIDHQLRRDVDSRSLPAELDCGWGALLLNAGDLYQSRLRLPWWMSRQRRKFQSLTHPQLKLIATLDELAEPQLAKRFPKPLVRWMPDMIEALDETSVQLAELDLACQSGRKILLSAGVMHRRKGFLNLLRVAASGTADGWFFLLVGSLAGDDFSDEELSLIGRAKRGEIPGVAMHDHYVDPNTLNACVRQSDCVYLGYERWTQSSNMMTRAAQLSTPILGPPDGLLAHRIRRDRLGWTLPDLTPEAIAAELRRLDQTTIHRMKRQGGFKSYAIVHDAAMLAETFAPVFARETSQDPRVSRSA